MTLTKTEKEYLYKDDDSNALISLDRRALAQHKLKRKKAEELKTQQSELNNIRSEVSELKDEICEIKDLLQKILTK